ncbi:MAG: hypothetical protein HY531_03425 [Chloroflexi bacterium]|nr:hypothetical protein [Chloroflexota bacterium]
MSQKPFEQVLMEHREGLMALPGVVATAQGESGGQPCILVLVNKKTPLLLRRIPDTIEGYQVDVEAAGEVRALGEC